MSPVLRGRPDLDLEKWCSLGRSGRWGAGPLHGDIGRWTDPDGGTSASQFFLSLLRSSCTLTMSLFASIRTVMTEVGDGPLPATPAGMRGKGTHSSRVVDPGMRPWGRRPHSWILVFSCAVHRPCHILSVLGVPSLLCSLPISARAPWSHLLGAWVGRPAQPRVLEALLALTHFFCSRPAPYLQLYGL